MFDVWITAKLFLYSKLFLLKAKWNTETETAGASLYQPNSKSDTKSWADSYKHSEGKDDCESVHEFKYVFVVDFFVSDLCAGILSRYLQITM